MLSSPAEGSSSLFNQLPTRPPTPPRDTSRTTVLSPDTNKNINDALRFLDEGHQVITEPGPSARVKVTTDTPPSKLSESRGSTGTKKVGFVLDPSSQQQAPGRFGSPRISHDSPASRNSGPLKSILKRSIEQLPPTPDDVEQRLCYFSPQEPGSFRKMLQSVLKQLGGQSRDGRRDAYLCLNGALKQFSDLPDREALVDKMDLLQQFISRDMAWKDDKGGLDLQIVTQALNLTSALLWDSSTAQALDDDFRSFIIDRSIVMLEQTETPKPVLKAHLHILMMQQFASTTMTQTKADRIVTALQNVEDRCTGNSVIAARLTVYQRLAAQQPSVMINRMQDWIGHVFNGMLSSVNDTRLRAIEACRQTAVRLGSYPLASKTLFEVFDAETDEEISYCEYFNKKLMEMTSDKELAHFVPQIWAAIILFFRTKRKPLDRWGKLSVFLATIQKCLNSGDMTVKHHAHIAWNQLIFAVSPDSSSTPSMRSMLRRPITTVLERRGNDKFSQQAKDLALHSYCYLLHYGLRPTLSHDELDGAWKLYVEEVLPKLVKAGRRGQVHACRFLQGVLQRQKAPWNENAAIESTHIKPEDLPSLDAKWVRSRLGKIIQVLEPIIAAGMSSAPDSNNAADACWNLLFQSVAEAGSQEVKTSHELKVALAELTNLLRRLWHTSANLQPETERTLWLDRYQLLLKACVDSLGPGHFVEDFLAKTSADEVEATPTPSNRISKHQKAAYSPFVFLFALYYQPSQNGQPSERYIQSAAWYLDLLAGARGSASGTIGLLHRSLQFCSEHTCPNELGEKLWSAVVDGSVKALARQTSTLPQHNAQTVGVALRSALNIIAFGLRNYQSSATCPTKATELYTATCTFAKQYGNDGGVALAVMEPLSKSLIDIQDEVSLVASLIIGRAILDNGVWPKNRQELEQSRKALWSVSLDPPSKTSLSIFDPFEQVYNMSNLLSQNMYKQLVDDSTTETAILAIDCLKSVLSFLQRCPSKILPSSFKRMQNAFTVLAEDRRRSFFPLLTADRDDSVQTMASEIPRLWKELFRIVHAIPASKDSSLLASIEPLMFAGLASPSKEIVNTTITFWNETFGTQDFLDYPAKLLPVLRARRRDAELQLPGLADDDSNTELAELPAFAESQDSSPESRRSPSMAVGRSPMPISRSSKSPRVDNLFIRQIITPLASNSSSATKRTKSSKRKARLRHDDSQLDFAPIEPSPSISATHESQLLTEHQREVQARQHGDAQMFPELSSSPVHSGRKSKLIAKKLDFSSDATRADHGNELVATPTGLADGNPMSDDLPSSPTPRASTVAQEVDRYSDDEATDIVDPPSSPPRQADNSLQREVDQVDETTVEIEDAVVDEVVQNMPHHGVEQLDDRPDLEVSKRDLVSDDFLPTAQLEREAAAAAAQEVTEASQMPPETLNSGEQDTAQDALEGQGSQTPSRIEESFVEPVERTPSQNSANSANATPSTGKSKRKKKNRQQNEADTPRKKAKKASPSPIKPFLNLFTSRQLTNDGHEEDEDIEDEIVVATRPRVSTAAEAGGKASQGQQGSQPERITHSQEEKHIKRRRGRPRKSYSQESEREAEPVAKSQEEPQPVKRGPGRPRKYPVRASSQTSTNAGLKRRASVMSNATADEQENNSYVADTPAPPTTRKAARLSQGAADAGNAYRRASLANAGTQEEEGEDVVETQRSATSTAAPSPKNILSRLYGVLADIPKMVFGSQEDERAMDDVLFEIRREVFEVGRRSRQQE